MYLQKVTSRKNCVKKLVFAGILNVNDENSRIGSNSQRHGSADPDPDPHQNVMDPEHWKKYSDCWYLGHLKVLSNGAGGGPKLVSIDPF